MTERVPMRAPDIRGEDLEAVIRARRSGQLSIGFETARLEAVFAGHVRPSGDRDLAPMSEVLAPAEA